MRYKVTGGLVTVAAMFALFFGGTGTFDPPDPTPTPAPGACLASAGCYPKPPGASGAGVAGIPPGTSLTACGATATISTPGAIIDSCTYTGTLIINATNVTVRNSRIREITVNNTGAVIEDSEIGPTTGCDSAVALIKWQGYTARRNYLHGNGDGFRFAGDNIVAEDNFVKTCDLPGDHSDGVQGNFSGQNNVVRHNTIDIRESTYGPNAAIFFADDSESATIEDNLLLAPFFALKVHDDHNPDVGPWVVTGNRIIGGTLTTNTNCATTTWTDNRTVTVDSNYDITSTLGLLGC